MNWSDSSARVSEQTLSTWGTQKQSSRCEERKLIRTISCPPNSYRLEGSLRRSQIFCLTDPGRGSESWTVGVRERKVMFSSVREGSKRG